MIREKIASDVNRIAKIKLAQGLGEALPTFRGYEPRAEEGPSHFRKALDFAMDKTVDGADWVNSGLDELSGYTMEDIGRGIAYTGDDIEGRIESGLDTAREGVSKGITDFDRAMNDKVWQPGRNALSDIGSGINSLPPEAELAMAREEMQKIRNMRAGNRALKKRMNDYADLPGIEPRRRAEESKQRMDADKLYENLFAERLNENMSENSGGIQEMLASLLRKGQEGASDLAGRVQSGASELASNVSEKAKNMSPEQQLAATLAGGGIGALGLVKLLRMLKGKGASPAPV